MDQKLSAYPVVSTVLAGDIIPIIRNGANMVLTAGVASLNNPNLGNKGVTKNVPLTATAAAIPLTSTIVALTAGIAHTLAAGGEGQSLTLVAPTAGSYSVASSAAKFTSVAMVEGSTLSLLFVGTKWFVTASHLCTIT